MAIIHIQNVEGAPVRVVQRVQGVDVDHGVIGSGERIRFFLATKNFGKCYDP